MDPKFKIQNHVDYPKLLKQFENSCNLKVKNAKSKVLPEVEIVEKIRKVEVSKCNCDALKKALVAQNKELKKLQKQQQSLDECKLTNQVLRHVYDSLKTYEKKPL